MRPLLLALLFTTACTTDNKDAPKHDPAPASAAATQREADNKATDVEQARNSAKLDVATAQAATDAAAAKARTETGEQLQKNFDAADRRLNAFKEKAAGATGTTKKRADAAIAGANKREASVMASIAKLRDASGATWDATKTQVDSDMVALNQAIDSVETALN